MAPRSAVGAVVIEKAAAAAKRVSDVNASAMTTSALPGDGAVVTKIHGAWYDLTHFDHPGGPVALSLGAHRDATGLFESYHALVPRDKLGAMMAKYRVGPEAQRYLDAKYAPELAASGTLDTGFNFNWEWHARSLVGADSSAASTTSGGGGKSAPAPQMDAFEADVKAIARAYFAAEAARRGVSLRAATKTTPARWAEVAALGAAFIVSAVLLVRGWWPAVVLAPLMCWLWMVNFWHDAAHFALSADWRLNKLGTYVAPWFSSPLIWHHQHNIGHHVWTNVPGRDPDLYHVPAYWRFTRTQRWRPLHAHMEWSVPVMWTFAVPTLLLLKPFQALFHGVYNRSVVLMKLPAWRVAAHVAGRLAVASSVYVWPWYVFPESRGKAAVFAVVPLVLFSMCFMAASQVNHHDEVLSDAADARWYRHQAMTSHTIAPQSRLVSLAMGGLNLQIEHHLLPGVNHCHLAAMQPAIEAAARKHGVPYLKSASIAEAFQRLWRHLSIMARKPDVQPVHASNM